MTRERSLWARRSLESTRMGRLRAIGVLALAGYSAVLLGAFKAHLIPDSRLEPWLAPRTRSEALERLRGSIVDRAGSTLVARGDTESLQAYPALITDVPATARALGRALQVPADAIRREIEAGKKRGSKSVYLRRWMEPEEASRVAALHLAGIDLISERRGKYPQGRRAAAYLGFAGYDEVAREGLELRYDDVLRGIEAPPAVSDEPASDRGTSRGPLRGATVQLALDLRLQSAGEDALEEGLRLTGARQGSLIALDPWTGDVLVVAEAPGFDPYTFRKADPERFRVRSFVNDFEPGSTIKPFTFAAALEAGAVHSWDSFDCEHGNWKLGPDTIHDHHPYGMLDVTSCMANSSNICAAKIAERLGAERLVRQLHEFGFGQPVPTDFPATAMGIVRDIQDRQLVDRANLAFGQGMRTSALQLALAGAVIANGGQRVAPRLALAIQRRGKREEIPTAIGPRVIRETTAREILRMMEEVVVRGTGTTAAIDGYRIAGKTGTAQKPLPAGGYSNEAFVASFLGIFPADAPRLVVVVAMDEPKRPNHLGAQAAAPVFRSFAEYAVQRLLIPADPGVVVAQGDRPAISEEEPTP